MQRLAAVAGAIRQRKIPVYLWVAASAWISRIVSATVQLIAVRYLIQSLGIEQYSTFALLGAVTAWAALADFGLGYSLQNYLSERRALGEESLSLVAAGTMLLLPLLLGISIALYLVAPALSLMYLKSAVGLSADSKTIAFAVAISLFIATSLGGIGYKIWFANQYGWLANIFPAIGALIGLTNISLGLVSYFSSPLLGALILFYGPPALIALLSLYLNCIRARGYYSWTKFRENSLVLIRRGWHFWLFAVVAAFVLQADYLVMSQRLRPEEIVVYSLLLKFFGLGSFVYTALLQALWPSCAELRAQSRWNDLRSNARRYVMYGIAGMICFTVLFSCLQDIIIHVLGVDQPIPKSTVMLFGTYFVVRAWTDTYSMLLQSMNIVAPLWKIVSVQAVLSLGLQWVFSGWYGVNGLLIGLILSFVLTVAIGIPAIFYSKLRSLAAAV